MSCFRKFLFLIFLSCHSLVFSQELTTLLRADTTLSSNQIALMKLGCINVLQDSSFCIWATHVDSLITVFGVSVDCVGFSFDEDLGNYPFDILAIHYVFYDTDIAHKSTDIRYVFDNQLNKPEDDFEYVLHIDEGTSDAGLKTYTTDLIFIPKKPIFNIVND